MKKFVRRANRVLCVILGVLVAISLVWMLFGAEFSTQNLVVVLGAVVLFVGLNIHDHLYRIESLK